MLVSVLAVGLVAAAVHADVTLDGTLRKGAPEGSTAVSPGHFIVEERYGEHVEQNLFHSFLEFDLDPEESVTFNGSPGIRNIIGRVTGGHPSTISGQIISAIPGANLFLLNPDGIVLSQGAEFHVDGSVNLSSASYLEFNSDQLTRFYSDRSAPVLSGLDVRSFGFLGAPSGVAIQGVESESLISGREFNLIGGDIAIEDSCLSFSDARVGLFGVGRGQQLSMGGDVSGLAQADAEVRIEDSSLSIQTVADSIGIAPAVVVAAGRLSLTRGDILASTEGPSLGGDITIDVRNLLSDTGFIQSSTFDGAGNAGNVRVNAFEAISLSGKSFLGSSSEGFGDGKFGVPGSVSVSAPQLTLRGPSFLGSLLDGSGAGRVLVDVVSDRIQLSGGALVGFRPIFSDSGSGGRPSANAFSTVRIRARDSIEVSGEGSVIVNGNINGVHDPLDERFLRIETSTLRLTDRGQIVSGTRGAGEAADIHLQVDDLLLDRSNIGSLSGLDGRGAPRTLGDAGDIEILAAHSIRLSNISVIDSGTRGAGKGGTLRIQAPSMTVDNSDVRSVTAPNPSGAKTGNAGNVEIETDVLEVLNGGLVRSDSSVFAGVGSGPEGLQGSAGNVDIRAGTVRVQGSGINPANENGETRSQISSRTTTEGAGGDVTIRARNLFVSEGGLISAETTASGTAGNVVIDADRVEIGMRGSISTGARETNGGNVVVTGDQLLFRGGLITTTGTGNGGNVQIDSEVTAIDDGGIAANAAEGRGGNVRLTSRFLIGNVENIQAASKRGLPGTISIASPELSLIRDVADLPATFLSAQKLLRPQCAARESDTTSRFVVAERSGVGASPQGWLLAFDDDGAPALSDVATGEGSTDYIAAAREARVRAAQAFRSGDYAAARQGFLDASASADPGTRSAALRGKAQVDQAAGDFRESVRSLIEALLAVEKSGNAVQIAAVLGSLGNAYVALEEPELAADHLARGLELARRAGAPALAAEILVNQGNHRAIQGELDAALASYGEAADLAVKTQRPLHAVQALANAARVALRAGKQADAVAFVERARTQVRTLPPTQDRMYALTHLAETELILADRIPASEDARMLQAHELLMEAAKLGSKLGAQRASSYALGNLAALYERDHRYEEALQGTYRALAAAERAGASESLYRLHWQAGRILGALGRRDESIEALRRAVTLLQKLRPEAAVSYTRSEVSFRDSVAPVYLSLLDALLSRADGQTDPEQAKRLLLEARSTTEEMRAAELRDYFRDECVADLAARARPVESVSADAAIVYPVVLQDRVELLVSVGGQMTRYVSPVRADELSAQAMALRQALQGARGPSAYLEPAQSLYRWLVQPYARELEKAGVRTLVFVPDGPLGTIPMAALHDGNDFLIRRFAVAVTPGLSLTDPRPLEREHLKVLVAGLSEQAQDYPALPHVADEVSAIQSLYPDTTVLLNDGFTEERTEKALASEPFSILHIASHGSFSADAARSFLLTHDGQISMRGLTELIGRTRFRDQPLELLVLSACETAAGDERAALGLAGVAIRSGARSALGSLWNIQDEAASRLVAEFYAQLTKPGMSRAEALRQAQLALLDQERFRDPGSWSGFLLINSWL